MIFRFNLGAGKAHADYEDDEEPNKSGDAKHPRRNLFASLCSSQFLQAALVHPHVGGDVTASRCSAKRAAYLRLNEKF